MSEDILNEIRNLRAEIRELKERLFDETLCENDLEALREYRDGNRTSHAQLKEELGSIDHWTS